MKTIMVASTDKNFKIIDKMKLSATDFCGWLTVTGEPKKIAKLAKINKVILY